MQEAERNPHLPTLKFLKSLPSSLRLETARREMKDHLTTLFPKPYKL